MQPLKLLILAAATAAAPASWQNPCAASTAGLNSTFKRLSSFVTGGGGSVAEGLCLARDEDRMHLRGLYTSKKLKAGTLLVSLPAQAILSLDPGISAAGKEAASFVRAVGKEIRLDLEGHEAIRSVVFAIFLQQLLQVAEAEAVGDKKTHKFWRKSYKQALKFHPFLLTLKNSSRDTRPTSPLLRAASTKGDIGILNGSMIQRRITKQLEGVRIIQGTLVQHAEALEDLLPYEVKTDELLMAMSITASRGTSWPTSSHKALTPIVDFVNHGEEANVEKVFPTRDGKPWLELRTVGEVAAGEELVFNYYKGGKVPLSEIFDAYGFTVPPAQLNTSLLAQRCVVATEGFDQDMKVLKEAAKWNVNANTTEKAVAPHDAEGVWVRNARRVRDEEALCARVFIQVAKNATQDATEGTKGRRKTKKSDTKGESTEKKVEEEL